MTAEVEPKALAGFESLCAAWATLQHLLYKQGDGRGSRGKETCQQLLPIPEQSWDYNSGLLSTIPSALLYVFYLPEIKVFSKASAKRLS